MWKATIGKGILRLSRGDYYWRRAGHVHFRLWGIILLVKAGAPDIARSAAARLAAETFWLPSALMPQRGVKWEPLTRQRLGRLLTAYWVFGVLPDGAGMAARPHLQTKLIGWKS